MKKLSYISTIALITMFATSAFAQVRRDYRKAPQTRTYRDFSPSVTNFYPQSGVPGTTVTINGKHLTRGTTVVYGGVKIAPQFASSSKIVFQVPSRANDARVALDLPYSRRDLSVGTFDVRPRYTNTNTTWSNKRNKIRSERKRHARRLVKLKRMLRIARSMDGFNGLERRIEAAIARENRRHKFAMSRLQRRYRLG